MKSKSKCIYCKGIGSYTSEYNCDEMYCNCAAGKKLIKRDKNIKPIPEWDIEEAKEWMFKTGMEHIKDGLKSEGADLMFVANCGTGCNSENQFRDTMKRICWWDDDDIDKVLKQFAN